ncbi:hypothetical protein GCM10007100_24410 [Roseibacillus persicicus]|uniref:Endonuclease/exonuclease/phosphatase domain-containing protein n=2 Tax=Roseibacillus persicicus TaxID=454148 RepID=A0A918WMD3_9BACT|nr:hypothetical protein GCM10007100_24410 [Roseibacillus persicicus]
MRSSLIPFFKNAPLMAGAFFLLFSNVGCKEQSGQTDKWISKPDEKELAASPTEQVEKAEEAAPETAPGEETVRFLSYNLENYLTMRRGKSYLPKPEKEIDALIGIIARQKPDILGICEIGKEDDLLDLQTRLKNVGIDLPHYEHTGGADDTRHLALLSRYPIVATDSQSDLSFELTGQSRVIGRGILDATVDIGGSELRFLGAHLKSKREIEDADQELIRQAEGRLLREHADAILREKPETMLIAYGDFNDTIGSKTLSIVRGRRNSKTHMPDFYFKDSRGELWTHFWDYQDVYSRFDYVLFSESLKSKLDGKACGIVDDPRWGEASDHRALLFVVRP